jgi:hypothetical protein
MCALLWHGHATHDYVGASTILAEALWDQRPDALHTEVRGKRE